MSVSAVNGLSNGLLNIVCIIDWRPVTLYPFCHPSYLGFNISMVLKVAIRGQKRHHLAPGERASQHLRRKERACPLHTPLRSQRPLGVVVYLGPRDSME